MVDKKTFKDLGLSSGVVNAINKKGFEEPTAIQTLTIPVMLKDDTNIIAQAQTGTGKTAAFGLPLLDLINVHSKTVQALILTPIRELAIQVAEEINSLKGDKDIGVIPIYGGQSIDQQLRRLKKGAHIVVGTPGRVIDHLNRKTLKIKNIEYLILDEADEMLNMGFIKDMEEIMKHTNQDKRTLLFSATIPHRIKDLARKYMDGYKLLKAEQGTLKINLTAQMYFEVKESDRFESLCRIVDIEENFYGMVFCRTKNEVDKIVRHLVNRGYDAEPIHGDISQAQRETTLGKFKRKKINILVATDVAARGIDVNNLSHVINYSLPQDPESYVHRVGRTGRAGKEGTAITFITPNEYKRLMFIQRIAKMDIKKSKIPEVDDIIKAKKKKIDENLAKVLENNIDAKYYQWAKNLLVKNNPTEILAAILNHSFENELNPNIYREIKTTSSREKPLDREGKTRLFVALGKKDKMNNRTLVDLIIGKSDIRASHIRDVQVLDKFSFITVPFEKAEKIIKSFKSNKQKPLISIAKDKK